MHLCLRRLSVRMTNVDTGQVVWESDWDPTHVFQQEMTGLCLFAVPPCPRCAESTLPGVRASE